ncbi:MAG: hypothetical protein KBC17_03135 [Candidatus Pacebacteria bacterium]|nr:hypothetical protein [Candidatus Paceibacterota bacterium]
MKFFGKIVIAVSLGLVLLTNPVLAVKKIGDAGTQLNQVVGKTGISQTPLPVFIGQMIKWALGTVGFVFFILMVYGGFLWMTARGNDDQVQKGKNTITAAVIGLAVIVSAYALTNFVTTRLIERKGAANTNTINEPLGCCIDWVDTTTPDDLNLSDQFGVNGTPSWRMTTQSDCKKQGETESDGDKLFGPEGEGYWKFYDGLNENQCEAKNDSKDW